MNEQDAIDILAARQRVRKIIQSTPERDVMRQYFDAEYNPRTREYVYPDGSSKDGRMIMLNWRKIVEAAVDTQVSWSGSNA